MPDIRPAQRKDRTQIVDNALGYIAQTGRLASLASASASTAAAVRAGAVGLRAGDVVSGIAVCVTAAPGAQGSASAFVGLADSSYNRLAVSADVAASLGTFTVTIASPGVFTLNGHGLAAGDVVSYTTTGALPTGLSIDTAYYVISAGLTANTFQVSTTSGGAAVNTSGTQSGTHTAYKAGLRATGPRNFPLTASYTVTADGLYYPEFLLATGYTTTQPSLVVTGGAATQSPGLGSNPPAFWSQIGQTTIPNPAVPITTSTICLWLAVTGTPVG